MSRSIRPDPALARRIGALLSPLLDTTAKRVSDRDASGVHVPRADIEFSVGDRQVLVQYRTRGDTAPVADAIRQAVALCEQLPKRERQHAIPLVVVPVMGHVGRQLCEQAGVSWLDLAGNARIRAPGLHVLVDGRRLAARPPRPRFNPFAPRASRIVRQLLLDPATTWTQQQLTRAARIDQGLASHVITQLQHDGYVRRDRPDARENRSASGRAPARIQVADPALLLDAWREAYHFDKHTILYGTVAARSGPALLDRVNHVLSDAQVSFATTGLPAASLLAPYAEYRTVTTYVEDLPGDDVLEALGFREGRRGSNLWLVFPNDDGVFDGLAQVRGVPCVSAVQCYIDLASQPERAADAAHELRQQLLPWAQHVPPKARRS